MSGTVAQTIVDMNYMQAVLVDYSKTFDRIDPTILLEKLKSFNIPTFLLHWICNFLSERTQRVKVGDVLSMCGEQYLKEPNSEC